MATIDGVGVRVVVDGRQGYAWAGSLDPDIVAETLEEARDNAGFGSPDEHHGLATPADAARPRSSARRPRPLARRAGRCPRRGQGDPGPRPRARPDGRRSPHPGGPGGELRRRGGRGGGGQLPRGGVATRRTVSSCGALALAGEGTATRTGYGWSVGREPADLDVDEAATMAVERTIRLLGAAPTSSRRLPVVFDPLVSASLIGVVTAGLNGEAVLKGRSMFVGRQGEEVAGPGSPSSTTRPTPRPTAPPPSTPRGSPPGRWRSSPPDG